MSVKKWQQLDKQTEEIHQKFRMDKINKEFGQLSGEEFFKPITKRLDEKSSTTAKEEEEEEEEQEVPDYTMDEFDEINPFGDEFRPDAPTPAPSPLTTPTTPTKPIVPTSQPPPYQEFDDYPLPPPSLMEETVMPGTSKDETKKETSNRLRNVKSILAKHKHDPTYKVKSKGSKYYGYDVEQLKAEVFNLETIKANQEQAERFRKRTQSLSEQLQERRKKSKPPEKPDLETIKANQEQAERLRKRTQSLSEQLQEGRKKLKPPEKPEKREITKTPIEKAVESRRPYLEPSDNEDDFSEQDWETEGSGIADEAELIDQLHLSLGSIKAGNNSIKLKKQVFSPLDSLVELGTINKKQKKKLLLII